MRTPEEFDRMKTRGFLKHALRNERVLWERAGQGTEDTATDEC